MGKRLPPEEFKHLVAENASKYIPLMEAFLDRTISADYSTKQSRQAVVDDLTKFAYSKEKESLRKLLDNLEECAPEKDAGFQSALGHAMLGLIAEKSVHAFLETKDSGKVKSTHLLAMTYLSFYSILETTYRGLKAISLKEKGINTPLNQKTPLKSDDYQSLVKVFNEGAPSAKDLATLKPMIEEVKKEIGLVENDATGKRASERLS